MDKSPIIFALVATCIFSILQFVIKKTIKFINSFNYKNIPWKLLSFSRFYFTKFERFTLDHIFLNFKEEILENKFIIDQEFTDFIATKSGSSNYPLMADGLEKLSISHPNIIMSIDPHRYKFNSDVSKYFNIK